MTNEAAESWVGPLCWEEEHLGSVQRPDVFPLWFMFVELLKAGKQAYLPV